MGYKIFKQCDDILKDYCADHNVLRKDIAQNMGLSYKQLNNVLNGEVESCFDVLVTIFAKYVGLGEHILSEVYEQLFRMMQARTEYITSKNLFTLFELSIITGKKHGYICEYLEKVVINMKVSKAIKQTIQIIFVIEKMFTFDSIKDLNFQSSSVNADYAKLFQPLKEKCVDVQFRTFLEYCLNMRRNERIAGYYYDHAMYDEAADIYELLYQLPCGKDNRRYLGYKLLQTLAKNHNHEKFELIISQVMHMEQVVFINYLNVFLRHVYYDTPMMSQLLYYWFTRNKEQLIVEFEQATNDKNILFTTKLLLSNLTKSCSYLL